MLTLTFPHTLMVLGDMYKSKSLVFRATPLEQKALIKLAKREGLNLSECLRFIIREAAQSAGFWPPKVNQRPRKEVHNDNKH